MPTSRSEVSRMPEAVFFCWKCGDLREEHGISVKDPPKQNPIFGYCPLCGKRDMGYRYSPARKAAGE